MQRLLEEFCRRQGLCAEGSKRELEERIVGAMAIGTRVDVQDDFVYKAGCIVALHNWPRCEFEAHFDDGSTGTFKTFQAPFFLAARQPSTSAQARPQPQRAAAQPGGREQPAPGAHQQQPPGRRQQAAQRLDLRAVQCWQLEDFCRRQGLYAGGSKQELEERIIGAMAVGTRVAAKNALLDDFKTGSITALRHQPRCEFEVRFDDGRTGTCKAFEATFLLADAQPSAGAQVQPQPQHASAWPHMWETPAPGTRQQQTRQEPQQAAQELLQEFCRRQGLYARGSKQELKLRIIGAMAIGTRVAVKNALFGDLKTGSITALRRQPRCEFEVRFDDGSTGTHEVFEATFLLADAQPSAGAQAQPQPQHASAQPPPGTRQQQTRQEPQQAAQELDLRAFERWQLQDFCSRQGLDAGGSRMELEERIVNAMAIGKRVAVQRPCPEWQSRGPGPRPGCIAALRHRPRLEFDAQFDDGTTDTFEVFRTLFLLVDAPPSTGPQSEPQRQQAAAQPSGREAPAPGARLQQPRQELQQGAQGLDLRAVELWQLQEFCCKQGLCATGSKPELEGRIIGAMAIGTRVSVENSVFEAFKTGSVAALRQQRRCAFEVRFDDGSTGAYDLFSATFYIVEDDGPGSSGLQTSGSFARRNSTGSSAYVWYANEEGRRDAEQVLSASPSLPRQPQSSGPSAQTAGAGGSAQQEEDDDNMCRVCFDEPRTVAFVPCGHFAACATCAAREEIRRACPYCKQRVTSTIRIYNV